MQRRQPQKDAYGCIASAEARPNLIGGGRPPDGAAVAVAPALGCSHRSLSASSPCVSAGHPEQSRRFRIVDPGMPDAMRPPLLSPEPATLMGGAPFAGNFFSEREAQVETPRAEDAGHDGERERSGARGQGGRATGGGEGEQEATEPNEEQGTEPQKPLHDVQHSAVRELARQCVCGNMFAEDAVYCRKCGLKRPEIQASFLAESQSDMGGHSAISTGVGYEGQEAWSFAQESSEIRDSGAAAAGVRGEAQESGACAAGNFAGSASPSEVLSPRAEFWSGGEPAATSGHGSPRGCEGLDVTVFDAISNVRDSFRKTASLQWKNEFLHRENQELRSEVSHWRAEAQALAANLEAERRRLTEENGGLTASYKAEHAHVERLVADLHAERKRYNSQIDMLTASLQSERATVEELRASLKDEQERLREKIQLLGIDLGTERAKADELATSLQTERHQRRVELEGLSGSLTAEKERLEIDRRLLTQKLDEADLISKQRAAQHHAEVQQLNRGHEQLVGILRRSWEHVALHMSDRILRYSAEVLKTELFKTSDCGEHAQTVVQDLQSYCLDHLARRAQRVPSSDPYSRGPWIPPSNARSVSPRRSGRR